MLRTQPEKLSKVLHDLYVLLPVIQEHKDSESVAKHLEIIEYYKSMHDEAIVHWDFHKRKVA